MMGPQRSICWKGEGPRGASESAVVVGVWVQENKKGDCGEGEACFEKPTSRV
jgi:hypothetical protein